MDFFSFSLCSGQIYFMMAYHKLWRKCHAEARALALESTSSSNEDNEIRDILQSTDSETQETNLIRAHEEQSSPIYDPTDETETLSDSLFSLSESEREDIGENCDVGAESKPTLSEELVNLATKHNCTRAFLNELLDILRRQGHRLPKDARTLLQTPRDIKAVEICNGDYIYFGIESGILKILAQNASFSSDCIELYVNVDGVPISKSSTDQLWPILCSFDKFEPFIVALFSGKSKPDCIEDYLNDFLEEYRELKLTGVRYNSKSYQVRVKGFVCDAPARAFLKCIKTHNGYFACERCTVKGTWKGRVVFHLEDTAIARNDEDFNNVRYSDHQVKKTPLIDVGVSFKDFTLDYMHLVCLGVVKRLLHFLKGAGPRECKLSQRQKDEISENLVALNGKMPRDFARQPRSLSEVDRWKATEYRQFILYTGPLALKKVVSKAVYTHFLSLTVAMSIMLDADEEKRNAYSEYAHSLLVHFVRQSRDIYGDTFTTYNVHSLIHLREDLVRFKVSLNEISAFKFENYMQKLKAKVKQGLNPTVEVAKRLAEDDRSSNKPTYSATSTFISGKTERDSCFLLQNEDFAFIREKKQDGKLVCDIFSQVHMESFFHEPCDSKFINIAFLRRRDKAKRRLLEKQDLKRKVAVLPYNDGHVLLPLLHGVERLM